MYLCCIQLACFNLSLGKSFREFCLKHGVLTGILGLLKVQSSMIILITLFRYLRILYITYAVNRIWSKQTHRVHKDRGTRLPQQFFSSSLVPQQTLAWNPRLYTCFFFCIWEEENRNKGIYIYIVALSLSFSLTLAWSRYPPIVQKFLMKECMFDGWQHKIFYFWNCLGCLKDALPPKKGISINQK